MVSFLEIPFVFQASLYFYRATYKSHLTLRSLNSVVSFCATLRSEQQNSWIQTCAKKNAMFCHKPDRRKQVASQLHHHFSAQPGGSQFQIEFPYDDRIQHLYIIAIFRVCLKTLIWYLLHLANGGRAALVGGGVGGDGLGGRDDFSPSLTPVIPRIFSARYDGCWMFLTSIDAIADKLLIHPCWYSYCH